MPAFDEVFQFSRNNQQWKRFLQEETKSSHVFVTKTFKVFYKRRNLHASVRQDGGDESWSVSTFSPPHRDFSSRGIKRLHEGEGDIISSPVQ